MLYSKIEGSGKPLLILHGFLGMSDNWKTLGVQFASEGFEVHILDLRNHGRSFHSDEFSYELMVQDIVQYCKDGELIKEWKSAKLAAFELFGSKNSSSIVRCLKNRQDLAYGFKWSYLKDNKQ